MDIKKAREKLILGKTIYDLPLRVVHYGRVSTDKHEQHNSLENQYNYFVDMIANNNNWTYIDSYSDEGISGTIATKREEFLRMIEDAKKGRFDLILTKEVSRFARNTIDSIKYTELLLSYGVIVFFISDNINTIYPDSEFRLTLMASMAQDEIRKLSERVKFGIKRSIKDGKLGGSTLTGYYKKSGRLYINKKQAIMIKKLFTLYASGEYGFKKIAQILADDGYYTKTGKIYSESTLKKMLQNYRYKGYYTANLSNVVDYKTHKKKKNPKEEWVLYKDFKIPAIVDEELWNRANTIYNERHSKYNINNKEEYLKNKRYTSKLICLEHNTTFIRCSNGKRKKHPVWQCNEYLRHGLKGCKTPIIKEEKLNMLFEELLKRKIPSNVLEEIIKEYKKITNTKEIKKYIINNYHSYNYVYIYIDKIFVNKIDGNRKKIRLDIVYMDSSKDSKIMNL